MGIRQKMKENKDRKNRQAATFFLILGAGFALLIVVMGVAVAIFNVVESSAVNDLYGETIAQSCQPVPVGSLSPDSLPDASPPRQLLLLTADSQRRHAWHSSLTVQWQAADEAAVALVGCVAEDYIELEECTYSRLAERGEEPYTIRVTREQHTVTITLINPTTGQRIDELTLMGSEPGPCPPDTDDLTTGRERGDDLTWADFAAWAEPYILE
jgi:hypothetical protein